MWSILLFFLGSRSCKFSKLNKHPKATAIVCLGLAAFQKLFQDHFSVIVTSVM